MPIQTDKSYLGVLKWGYVVNFPITACQSDVAKGLTRVSNVAKGDIQLLSALVSLPSPVGREAELLKFLTKWLVRGY